jgi:hypothetical protein
MGSFVWSGRFLICSSISSLSWIDISSKSFILYRVMTVLKVQMLNRLYLIVNSIQPTRPIAHTRDVIVKHYKSKIDIACYLQ